MNTYYNVSPSLAEFIAEHNTLRTVVRVGIVEPMVRALELSEGNMESLIEYLFRWNKMKVKVLIVLILVLVNSRS